MVLVYISKTYLVVLVDVNPAIIIVQNHVRVRSKVQWVKRGMMETLGNYIAPDRQLLSMVEKIAGGRYRLYM